MDERPHSEARTEDAPAQAVQERPEGAPPAPLSPGRVLAGRYRLAERLTETGIGELWRACDQRDDADVALRVLPHFVTGVRLSVKCLEREVGLYRDLDHPHIGRLLGFHNDAGVMFLVMEYVPGSTLEELLDARADRRLDLEELIPVARDVAEAIDHAHELDPPLPHRDIKPSNIMITPDGHAKLTEFGVAWEQKESLAWLTDEERSGTLLYMSPEQTWGDRPSTATDVYAFAGTLFECLSGHPPFYRDDDDQLIYRSPSDLPDVPAGARQAILAGLAVEADDRPPSAGALAEALGELPPGSSRRTLAELQAAGRQRTGAPPTRDKRPTGAGTLGGTEWDHELDPDWARSIGRLGARASAGAAVAAVGPEARRGSDLPIWLMLLLALGVGGIFTIAVYHNRLPEMPIATTFPAGMPQTSTAPAPPPPPPKPWIASELSPDGRTLAFDLGSGARLVLRRIAPGEFIMGSPETETGRADNEGPQRRVEFVRPFYLGICEVSQEQYFAVLGKNPSFTRGPKHPVERVSWNDAAEFCARLALATDRAVRLPTEAEWEYACRAGTTTRYSFGHEEESLHEYGNYCDRSNTSVELLQDSRFDDGHDQTAPVGSFKPNAWGLYDMHGNVWEWCADFYDAKYYAVGGPLNPRGPEQGRDRVLRGGSWGNHPKFCRSAFRAEEGPVQRRSYIGFRIAVDWTDDLDLARDMLGAASQPAGTPGVLVIRPGLHPTTQPADRPKLVVLTKEPPPTSAPDAPDLVFIKCGYGPESRPAAVPATQPASQPPTRPAAKP